MIRFPTARARPAWPDLIPGERIHVQDLGRCFVVTLTAPSGPNTQTNDPDAWEAWGKSGTVVHRVTHESQYHLEADCPHLNATRKRRKS